MPDSIQLKLGRHFEMVRRLFIGFALAVLAAVGLQWVAPRALPESSFGAEPILAPVSQGVDREAAGASPPDLTAATAGEDGLGDFGGLPPTRFDQNFAGATLLAERFEVLPDGLLLRLRLFEDEDDPFRYYRLEERFTLAENGRDLRPVSSQAMLADRLAVGIPEGVSREDVLQALAGLGYPAERLTPTSPVVQLRLPKVTLDAVPEALAVLAEAFPGLEAEPDFVHFPGNLPNDWRPAELWGLTRVEAPAAWRTTTGSAQVAVAVIDSGIDLQHPDLRPNRWINPGETPANGIDDDGNGFVDDINGWDFVDKNNDPRDLEGHGTHVAGTIGAVGNNNRGIVGMNWTVRLIALRVGDRRFPNSLTIQALDYTTDLRNRGIRVVATNNSYGSESFSSLSRSAIARSRDAGILFVAAAGNESTNNDSTPHYPSSYNVANIIAVASSNTADRLSSFSNYGQSSVHLAAPGTAIYSTIPGGGYDYKSGTSMATPMVAGALALLAAAEPTLSWQQARTRLLESVDPQPLLINRVSSGGRLNVRRLLGMDPAKLEVEVVRPAGRIVHLPDSGHPLPLDVQVGGAAAGSVSYAWSVIEGGSVGFDPVDAASTQATFTGDGVYRLRVEAKAGDASGSADRVVVVGPIPAVENGLVAHWTFDEAGGNALDQSGSGRHGQLQGASRVDQGLVGRAAYFDGVSSKISFSAPQLTRMTLAAWARAESAGNSIFPRIINLPNYLLYYGQQFGGEDANDDTLKFFAEKTNQDGVWYSPPKGVRRHAWTHTAATYDSTVPGGFPRLYLDGEPQVVGVQVNPTGVQRSSAGTGYLGENGEGTRAWHGTLDEVRIYDRELTPTEIALLLLQPLRRSGVTTGLDLELKAGEPMPGSELRLAVGFDGSPPPEITYRWSLAPGSPPAVTSGAAGQEFTAIFSEPGSAGITLEISGAGWSVFLGKTLQITTGGSTPSFPPPGQGSVSSAQLLNLSARAQVGSGAGVLIGGFVIEGQGPRTLILTGKGPSLPEGALGSPVLADPRLQLFGSDGLITANTSWLNLGESSEGLEDFGFSNDHPGEAALVVTLDPGVYTVHLSGVDGGEGIGLMEIFDRDAIEGSGSESSRLTNLSARARVATGARQLIGGLVIGGTGTGYFQLNGIGPSLAQFFGSGALADPRITLFSGSTALATNAAWKEGEDADLAATSPFAPKLDEEASLLMALEPGAFTLQLRDVDGQEGIGLVEIYALPDPSTQ
ncbi:MAG: hypothetical protein EA425_15550 [Puniceicoccaceae bacterium]|nr:MAG: hypothetical protein EA425_15550 [Puniceicoccaceae bacterium]